MAIVKQNQEQRMMVLLRANIEKHQTIERKDKKAMGKLLGINPEVFRRKTLHPELFTYPELVTVFKVLKFTPDEILESI